MSEEILKALTQLFAILTRQDKGVDANERTFVEHFFRRRLSQVEVERYMTLYDEHLAEGQARAAKQAQKAGSDRLTSVKDSVRTLSICNKINRTLTQKQKAIVIADLLELVWSDREFSPQQRDIMETVSTVFNLPGTEYHDIEAFVLAGDSTALTREHVLIQDDLAVLRVESVELYFVKLLTEHEATMGPSTLIPDRVYLFSPGSTVRPSRGKSLYYSDVVAHFQRDGNAPELAFEVKDLEFRFPNGHIGLREINMAESQGQLLGIMGASGAGKTTLLNTLAGLETPSGGSVTINGVDLHRSPKQMRGVIGYVAQDDLLVEELTVFENLYYAAKLSFGDLSEKELRLQVRKTLESLGLRHIQELKVGSPLNKKISGGQRKRLNIALELIREPAVLFVDEPTSGLSSRDSQNVIDLLKELALKGKLIFVVIHQPSSEIFKQFDKLFLLDTGGYPIYYGPPVEAVTYFRQQTEQINAEQGECITCGNVNPEQVFDLVEARVVNEYGQHTSQRKIEPDQWFERYQANFERSSIRSLNTDPPGNLRLPSKLRQWLIFLRRDAKSKLANTQYLIINLVEAPVLALLLAFLIRYPSSADRTTYEFRGNENLPAYLLMAIVVALFMGLTVSAEEILRDRKLLQRESFLHLSRHSYLMAKIALLFFLSAIQTLAFVLIGNAILEIEGMTMAYWMILFAVACFANLLGLNISASFSSAVTVYVLIPLLLIPQMILSGALFPFERIHPALGHPSKVPIVADLMVSRWAYEALAVRQFEKNAYMNYFIEEERLSAQAHHWNAYLFPELDQRMRNLAEAGESAPLEQTQHDRELLYNGLHRLAVEWYPDQIAWVENELFRAGTLEQAQDFLAEAKKDLSEFEERQVSRIDKLSAKLDAQLESEGSSLQALKNAHHNEALEDLVRNTSTTQRLDTTGAQLILRVDPVFQEPTTGFLRTHFYSPTKRLFSSQIPTYTLNLLVLWLMTLGLYPLLYSEALRRLLRKLSPGQKR